VASSVYVLSWPVTSRLTKATESGGRKISILEASKSSYCLSKISKISFSAMLEKNPKMAQQSISSETPPGLAIKMESK